MTFEKLNSAGSDSKMTDIPTTFRQTDRLDGQTDEQILSVN